jgi:predicted amidohydrolase
MQDLKIAMVQADQVWENKQANLGHYEFLLKDLEKVDLIVLPEMFHTGFSMEAQALAETMDGPALQWLKELASSKDSAVYTSLIIKDEGMFFNRGVFVEPDGSIHIYNKRKTFGLAGEDKVYTSGSSEMIVPFRGFNFQLQICYDLRFPEIVRNRMDSNGSAVYDVILYVANWPQRRNIHWKTLLRARAIENQCYVIGVNRVGEDGKGLNYSGDSALIDALGEISECEEGHETVKIVTVSRSALEEVRKALPFLRDR